MRSFRSQVSLLYGIMAVVTITTICVATTRMLTRHETRNQGEALQALANSTAAMLGEGMHERLREIELLADAFNVSDTEQVPLPARMRQTLERTQQARSQYAWIGLTNAQGQVTMATHDILVGLDISQRPWFAPSQKGPYVGDVHDAAMLSKVLPPSADGTPLRVLDFGAPILDANGQLHAILAAHVNWQWVHQVIGVLRHEYAANEGLQVFILDRSGKVIHRPAGAEGLVEPAAGQPWPTGRRISKWSDGRQYLSATATLDHPDTRTWLGWTIVVRQPREQALAATAATRDTMVWLGAVGALVSMGLIWLAAGRVSRPLQKLTLAAHRIREGAGDVNLPTLLESRELRSLSAALRAMTETLQDGQRELAQLNAALEDKVKERTQELEQANAELANLAQKDGLTGLFNRRASEERMDQEAVRHRRTGKPFSLLVLDIDHFKRINDTFGHAIGDEALRRVATGLQAHCRSSDFVARIGGEEFMLLLPETDLAGALETGEKLRCAISELPIPGVGMLTVSVGAAQSQPEINQAIRSVLKAADDALYRAKHTGRNRVVAAIEPMHA